ncbi:hypothetical protein SESBI_22407 [Sesbania bispinosa]|nr:hypothetical protein SESBI_22407 [Sesbania bispinosa]
MLLRLRPRPPLRRPAITPVQPLLVACRPAISVAPFRSSSPTSRVVQQAAPRPAAPRPAAPSRPSNSSSSSSAVQPLLAVAGMISSPYFSLLLLPNSHGP